MVTLSKVGKSKFGNISKICRYGHKHPSKGEANYCDLLHLRLAAVDTDIRFIHYERSYDLKVNGKKVAKHLVDWTLEYFDGTVSVVEFKGVPTAAWRIKKKLFEAIYPDIKYEVVYGNKKR